MGIDFLKSTFPEWYKDWVFQSLNLSEGDEVNETILKPLFALNKNWLQENYNQEDYSWNERDVARSYALYYMTINIPKLWMVMNHSNHWKTKHINDVSSVTEFGSGPGTFIWSYLFYLRKHKPEALKNLEKVTAVDLSAEHLAIAEELFRKVKAYKEFSHLKADFIVNDWRSSYENYTSDLNIFGNSLIESGVESNFFKIPGLKNVLIIEPGTREQFTRLRKVKDDFAQNEWHVHFPCPTSGSCPMDETNWCHFSINRFILPYIQKMSSAAGRKNHRHNFSAFLISKNNNGLSNRHWRVLSSNRKVKRTSIRFICNGEKLTEAVLNRKERSELNKDFIKCETGCCCYTSEDLKGSRLKAGDSFTELSEID